MRSGPIAASLPGKTLGGRVRLRCRVDSRVQGRRHCMFASPAARGIGIAAVVADHLLVGVGDVGSHQSDPVRSIQTARDVNPRQCSARPVSQQRTQPLAGRVSPSQWFGPGPPCPTTWPAAGTSFACGTGHVLLMHLRAVRSGTGYHHVDQALRHCLRRPRIVISYCARDLTRGNRLPWLSIRC